MSVKLQCQLITKGICQENAFELVKDGLTAEILFNKLNTNSIKSKDRGAPLC